MIEIHEETYGGIRFGGSEKSDFLNDYFIAEQLYAQMMGWV